MGRTVSELMTRDVASVDKDTPFKGIADRMVEHNVSALPVVEEERVVGMVSETDLMHKTEFAPQPSAGGYHVPLRARLRDVLGGAGSGAKKAAGTRAEELMSEPVVAVGPEDTTITAARLMERYNVKQLPVVDERKRLLGIISRRDLLRVFARPDEEIARDVRAELAAGPTWLESDRVEFTVEDGIVTVDGRLEQRSHCAMITRLISRVDGVVDVRSRLAWDVDDLLPAPRPSLP